MHGSCLVSCAAPVGIVYKIKTRNACTTVLKSSAYIALLRLHALLLNRPHLECVSESGCSSLCQLRSNNERTHSPLTDNKYTFNLFYADIRDITSALWTLENCRYQYKATLLTLLETSSDSPQYEGKKKRSQFNVTVPAQKVMSFSIELMLQHRFETVLGLLIVVHIRY